MHVGTRIKQLIETEGLSITEVAQAIDKTRQTVYDLFTKQHVSTEILEKLSSKYAVPMAYFFDEYFPAPANLTPTAPTSTPPVPVDSSRHPSNKSEEDTILQTRNREGDLHKIIYLQEKLLTYERGRQSFLLFLDRLRQSIIARRGYQKRLPADEEQEQLQDTSFSEAYQISADDNQQAYREIFEMYADFEVFFVTGFITDVYWRRAWQRYQADKAGNLS